MATCSFDKTFVVRNEKTAEYIRENLNRTDLKSIRPNTDFHKKLEEGKELLKQL